SLNLEIKRCDPDVLAEMLREFLFPDPPLVSSFDAAFLSAFRRTGYRAPLGLLDQYEPVKDRLFRKARECGASVILPLYLGVDRELVTAAQREGLRVITWTVNTTSALRSLLEWGVDGVITDDYSKLRSFLEEKFSAVRVPFPTIRASLEGLESS
ncbi:MAG: glycerophosphodiester phosphodiesterase, partial [Actinomycetota bacterium]|nr:glycerophosphodiester phosphodiesterase [Actinomycetota bacterium]